MIAQDQSSGLIVWFRQQFLQRTGIWIRDKDVPSLKQTLEARVHACHLTAPDAYRSLLATDKAAAVGEWKLLTETLKNGESFFFRDQAQIGLLRSTILPELIANNSEKRSLRIWSAGCSTGEEPYSLAILLYELLPKPEDWNLMILGTDLSDESIVKARRGRYGSWSFRMVDPGLQRRYFKHEHNSYLIDSRIRHAVTLRQGNLLKDEFPGGVSGVHDMDLILCRNVFIYFEPQGIATVVSKFARSLSPKGYLMTGHAELHQQDLKELRAIRYPESIIYQRSEGSNSSLDAMIAAARALPQGKPSVPAVPAIAPPVAKPILPVKPSLPSPIKTAGKPVGAGPNKERDDLLASARAHANAGRHEIATEYCRRAIQLDSVSYEAYYLLAQIREETGNWESAKELLTKVIYLAPQFAPAYQHLSTIHEAEGRHDRATTLRNTAQELLAASRENAESDAK